MRVLALVSLAATSAAAGACGHGSPAPRPPAAHRAAAAAPAATTPAAPATTTDLLASLAVTGATWEAALARVPPQHARRVAMDFLRAGDLSCRRVVVEEVGCGSTEESFAPVEPEATLEDPCLRRHVAKWALAQLEATDAPAVADALAAIVALPRPEEDLTEEVVALLPPGDDALRLRLIAAAIAAARADVADALLPGLTPFGAASALLELRYENALDHLGDHPQPATLVAALDNGVSISTAHEILERFTPSDLETPAVAEVVRRYAAHDHCLLAATAATLFDEAGDPQYLPSHAALTTEAAATRALCIAGQVSTPEALAVLRTLVSRDGLDLISIDRDAWPADDLPDPDLDGDGDPHTTATREHVAPGALDGDALIEWLPTECDGTSCAAPAGGVTLGFSRTPRGGLALDEITVERLEHGCGC